MTRFFLGRDNDHHWYLVDAARHAEWSAWLDIPSDDERSWEPPDFAKPLNGSPSRLTFTDPQVTS